MTLTLIFSIVGPALAAMLPALGKLFVDWLTARQAAKKDPQAQLQTASSEIAREVMAAAGARTAEERAKADEDLNRSLQADLKNLEAFGAVGHLPSPNFTEGSQDRKGAL